MFIQKLERKFGRYTIHNLSLVIIGAYVLGYILQMVAPNAIELLYLDPYQIIHGQIWRIVSWILIPPYSVSIFTMINLFFFYSLGRTLERLWGEFKYNVYIFMGLISVVVGVFIIYIFVSATGLFGVSIFGAENFSKILSYYVSTYYINISVILAFAMSIPDMTVLFWFFIPLKMKWLAYLEGAFLLVDFIRMGNNVGRAVMIVSLLNFFIFFFNAKNGKTSGGFDPFSAYQRERKKTVFRVYKGGADAENQYGSFTKKPRSAAITRHKCAICGQTEVSNTSLTFRFCSKCNGNYEYCENHLFTHEHIQ